MFINPLSNSIASRLFLAPDADASTVGGGDINVPVIPAAGTGPTVTEINLDSNPAIDQSSAVQEGAAARKAREQTTKGPEDFGMESPEESSERSGLTQRARGEDGKFVKREGATTTKPAATKSPTSKNLPPAAKVPAPAAKAAAPATPQKFKIGDMEKTADEWAAYHKELAEKSAKVAEPPAAPALAKPPETVKTPEQEAAAQAERETNFIKTARERYLLPEAELDTILVGGQAGAEKLAEMLARAEMTGRQFSASKLQEMADHFEHRLSELAPIQESHQSLQRMMQETAVLNANPTLKAHPAGAETYRSALKDFEDGAASVRAKMETGTASKTEHGWLLQYEDMSPDQVRAAAAEHAMAKIKTLPAPTGTGAAPAPAPKPSGQQRPAVVEKPLGGDRPGGASAPRTETAEARMAREVMETKGYRAA